VSRFPRHTCRRGGEAFGCNRREQFFLTAPATIDARR